VASIACLASSLPIAITGVLVFWNAHGYRVLLWGIAGILWLAGIGLAFASLVLKAPL
jgi:hypothetical protein